MPYPKKIFFLKFKKNRDAFSIIEMMIVMSMISMSSLATMTLVSYQLASQKAFQINSEIREFSKEIQYHLSYRGVCTANFGGALPGLGSLRPWDSNGISTTTNQGEISIGNLYPGNPTGIIVYNYNQKITNPDDNFEKRLTTEGGSIFNGEEADYINPSPTQNDLILSSDDHIVSVPKLYDDFNLRNIRWSMIKFNTPLRNNLFILRRGSLSFSNPSITNRMTLKLVFEAIGKVLGPQQSTVEIPIIVSGFIDRASIGSSTTYPYGDLERGAYTVYSSSPTSNHADYTLETCRALPPHGYF